MTATITTNKNYGRFIYPEEHRPGSILELALLRALDIYKRNQSMYGPKEAHLLEDNQRNIERVLTLLEERK